MFSLIDATPGSSVRFSNNALVNAVKKAMWDVMCIYKYNDGEIYPSHGIMLPCNCSVMHTGVRGHWGHWGHVLFTKFVMCHKLSISAFPWEVFVGKYIFPAVSPTSFVSNFKRMCFLSPAGTWNSVVQSLLKTCLLLISLRSSRTNKAFSVHTPLRSELVIAFVPSFILHQKSDSKYRCEQKEG